MLRKLQKRFILFNMLTIGCILCILAFFIYLGSHNRHSPTRYITTLFIILCVVYAGSSAISKFALLPIKRSWQKQLNFTADASHELRTPLTVIKTNLEIVMDNPSETVESHMIWLKNIETEHIRMTKLVEDLLTLSRADTSEQNLYKTMFLLDESIQKVIDSFQPVCEQKEIILTYEIEPHISLIGDESRITQLIVILLDNAFQYTQSGGSITLILHRKEKITTLSVQDTGAGISKEDLEKIYDRFYRVTNSRQLNPDGSGLGLSIAKWIVEQHNGSIHAKSKFGDGTTFYVDFYS